MNQQDIYKKELNVKSVIVGENIFTRGKGQKFFITPYTVELWKAGKSKLTEWQKVKITGYITEKNIRIDK